MKRLGVAAPLFGVFLLACGSDPVNGTGAPATSSTTPMPSSSSSSTAPPALTCDEPDYSDDSLPLLSVGPVSVTLHDPSDAPIVGQPTYVCGAYVCGRLELTVDDGSASPGIDMPAIKPALKFGDAVKYPELAILMDDPAPGMKFPVLTLPPFPDQGVALAPGTTSTSNGVSLTLAANANPPEVDPTIYGLDDPEPFRAVELPPEHIPDGLDHGAGLERVFALEPSGTELCPPAALSVPNSAGWAPGTEVEFLIQGLGAGDEQLFAPYADWQSIGTGAVDDAGENLVLTNGALPIIYTVGVRRL
ncbi:MAG TPA: hypothetical protein VMI54_23640 [Polyangiaceae bacterium]|nr:hypothetical protein [Polyangiaceae bacterium]